LTCVSEAGWIMFEEQGDDEDQTVPSFQADEEQAEEEDEEEEETGGKASRPERPPLPGGQQHHKTRDEIAKERALAKYSAQLEQGP